MESLTMVYPKEFVRRIKLAPAKSAFGCVSLFYAVQGICCISLVIQVVFIACVSSTKIMDLGGWQISPGTQIVWATWFFLGIPVVISGAVGTVFRVEGQVRCYTYYLLLTWATLVALTIGSLIRGEVCKSVASADLNTLGRSMVCGFTDSFALFWLTIVVLTLLYCTYLVWSMAEQIKIAFFPELEAKLKKIAEVQKEKQALGAPPSSQVLTEDKFRERMQHMDSGVDPGKIERQLLQQGSEMFI